MDPANISWLDSDPDDTYWKPIIDEVVLKEAASSGITIAEDFLKCLDITKSLGMISEGTNAWLKHVRMQTCPSPCSVATNTHRCAHRNPNLGQVKSDPEFRKLFQASPGQIMVGANLAVSSLDARTLPR